MSIVELSLDEKLEEAYKGCIEIVQELASVNSKPSRYIFKDIKRKVLDTEILIKAITDDYINCRDRSTSSN